MSAETVIGWDIGGAHLKACLVSREGKVLEILQLACPLWQGMDQLHDAIDRVQKQFNVPQVLHAITMTGELADLFSSRQEGVRCILSVMAKHCPPQQMLVFAGKSGFLHERTAVAQSQEVASANWCASAILVSHHIPNGLFVDIGSTTTDIVPFANKAILTQSVTDRQRLIANELVYTGIARTPLMAVTDTVKLADFTVPLMAEYFATTADIYRILEQLPDHADQHPAADMGEKSIDQSMRRLARMVAADKEEYPDKEWRLLAEYFSQQQRNKIINACKAVISMAALAVEAPVVAAGTGRFLLPEISNQLQRRCVDFTDCLQIDVSGNEFDAADCAPAVAVALLAWEASAQA